MTLGKGLESLIPPIKKKDGDNNTVANQDEDKAESAANSNYTASILSQESDLSLGDKENHSISSGQASPNFIDKNLGGQAIFQIEVDKIKPNPHQPRKDFDEESLRDLASSIREVGILQPLVVTKVEKETSVGTEVEYILVAGERRLLAAKLLGLERVPVIVKRLDFERERLEMAIIENLQRENLNPIETARAFSRLQDEFNLTQREIATRLGKSREAIANTVRLLDLPVYIQEALSKNQISETHGRLLLSMIDPAAQKRLFDDILDSKMTTRELKAKVEFGRRDSAGGSHLAAEIKMAEAGLTSKLGAPVKIEQRGVKGKITISFFSDEELKSILDKIGS